MNLEEFTTVLVESYGWIRFSPEGSPGEIAEALAANRPVFVVMADARGRGGASLHRVFYPASHPLELTLAGTFPRGRISCLASSGNLLARPVSAVWAWWYGVGRESLPPGYYEVRKDFTGRPARNRSTLALDKPTMRRIAARLIAEHGWTRGIPRHPCPDLWVMFYDGRVPTGYVIERIANIQPAWHHTQGIAATTTGRNRRHAAALCHIVGAIPPATDERIAALTEEFQNSR